MTTNPPDTERTEYVTWVKESSTRWEHENAGSYGFRVWKASREPLLADLKLAVEALEELRNTTPMVVQRKYIDEKLTHLTKYKEA